MTFQLPFPNIRNDEIRQNFETVEGQMSLFTVEDTITPSEVKGTKAKKIALRDPLGNLIGYIPLYAE